MNQLLKRFLIADHIQQQDLAQFKIVVNKNQVIISILHKHNQFFIVRLASHKKTGLLDGDHYHVDINDPDNHSECDTGDES